MHHSPLPRLRVLFGSLLALLVGAVALPPAGHAQTGLQPEGSRSLVLPVGRSTLLRFDRMKRVEVVEPTLVEVIVASLNDLSVYGKKDGMTTLYVWDRKGLHQLEVTVVGQAPAEVVLQNLRRVLGNRLTYSVSGDRVLVVEGTLAAEEAERAHKVIQAATGGDVQIVDLVKSEGATEAPAVVAAQALRRVLGEQPEYVVWNNRTLIVRGALGDKAELERARKLLEATKTPDLTIVDLLAYEEPQAQPPVEQIARAVGEQFQVWRVQGSTVAVSGTVMTKEELANLDKILEAFKDQARVVNLVQVVPPRQELKTALSLVQGVVGEKLAVRAVNNEAIFIEGSVANAAELERLRAALRGLKLDYQLVDLLKVAQPDKRQVQVHARLVLVNRGALAKLGVGHGQVVTTPTGEIVYADQPWLVQLEGGINNVFTLGAQVDLLRTKNLAHILSEPSIMVDDGGVAELLAGGEIPIPVAQAGGGVSSVTIEWKAFGVSLRIEPRILEDGRRLCLKTVPRVSSLDYSNAVTISGFVLPALRSSTATTEVTMDSGRTLVIGGLLHKEDSRAVTKIPLIAQLPIIGELFKRKEFKDGTSELVIMITPEIVGEKPEAAQP